MGRLSKLRSGFVIALSACALAAMVGCQGFSTTKPASQGTTPTPAGDALSAAPSSVTFGNVQVGTSQSQSETVINTGTTTLNITQATFTGAGFSATGLTLPLSLAAGQSSTFNIVFSPQSVGGVTGNLALSSDASSSPLNIVLTGTAVASGSLSGNPTSFLFGNVLVGSLQTQTETLNNSGSQSLTITQVSSTAAAFGFTGLTLPMTLAPSQSTTFGVTFQPTAAGSASGILSLAISGSSTTLDFALSGTGVLPAALAATPASLSFTGVQVGKSQTQTETVQNTGGSSATISQDSVSGNGFTISGLTTPVTLAPGQSTTFSVTFAPQSPGSFSGSASIYSNASDPNLNIPLSGSASGQSQGQLSVSPSTIGVGNVTVGTSGTQTATLNAAGASVTVSGVSVGSAEFSISGLTFPVTLSAGQSANFTVTFAPQSSGFASVSASFASSALNAPAVATLTGTGIAAPVHDVNLSWTASTSPNIIGYNVYRRTGAAGKFTQINAVLDATTSYTDSSVVDGQTYFYETTAVNSGNEESAPSSPVEAVIPAP